MFRPMDRSWLETERKKHNKTQSELAEKAGVHVTRYNRIERGLIDPTLREAFLIAKALGFDVNLFDAEHALE